jgi:putative oxidoreductase
MTPSSVPSTSLGLIWLDRLARVVVAAILVQTLYFKFTGAPESIFIFTTVGQEPWGRYGSGLVEALASVLLFVPGTVAVGAALALGTMSGAIFFHLTRLGIEVQGDGGLLFSLAVVVWICSAGLLWRHRRSLPVVGSRL